MHQLIQILSSLPIEVWMTLGGIVVSILVQVVKKWLDLQSDKVIVLLATTLSAAVAVIPSFVDVASQNPTILGQHTLAIVGFITLFFRFAVQPASNFIVDYRAYRKSKQSAETVPAETTPVATAPLAVDNSSEFAG